MAYVETTYKLTLEEYQELMRNLAEEFNVEIKE